METNAIDALIFDLDGTLWDASESCAAAWNNALRQTGIADFVFDAAKVRSVSGLRIEKILADHFAFLPAGKHQGFLALYRKHEADSVRAYGGKLFAGVKETLAALIKDYRLFVVSNCNAGYIENFLRFHGLQALFTDFECSGNTGLPKSENIRLIIKRNGLEHPVYIGDTVWDGEAAFSANVPFIHASYGFGQIEKPLLTLENIAELPSLLLQIHNDSKQAMKS